MTQDEEKFLARVVFWGRNGHFVIRYYRSTVACGSGIGNVQTRGDRPRSPRSDKSDDAWHRIPSISLLLERPTIRIRDDTSKRREAPCLCTTFPAWLQHFDPLRKWRKRGGVIFRFYIWRSLAFDVHAWSSGTDASDQTAQLSPRQDVGQCNMPDSRLPEGRRTMYARFVRQP